MDKPSLSNKVFTENPLLDEIIYNLRQLVYGTVLKDQDKADREETEESIQYSDLYMSIKSGIYTFEYFEYSKEVLMAFGYSEEDAIRYAVDNTLIPTADRDSLATFTAELYIENYVEYNNYYRMLHGLPSYDETETWQGIYIHYTEITSDSVCTEVTPICPIGTDEWKLIHELDTSYIYQLYSNGTIDYITETESLRESWDIEKEELEYLKHMSYKSIDYYEARKAERFGLLYCPESDSEDLRKRYMELLGANRLYVNYSVYSQAYKYASDYYDAFCMIMIIIQTMIDMIIELPEYLIRRDVFDTRTCKYIFESNGVKYFEDIPLKYQISLVKNLNKFIRLKSTDKCIVDIAALFGSENINIFKYYILRSRNVTTDSQGNLAYVDVRKSTGEEDTDANYDLKFIKVPILGNYDDSINTPGMIVDYEDIVDEYWYGDSDPEEIKSEIKAMDFTVLKSKYYSIQALVDLTKKTFDICYFTNMMMFNKLDASAIKVSIPYIDTTQKFEFVDIMCVLFSLGYLYYDADDRIYNTQPQVLSVLGFNMDADINALSEDIYETYGKTLDQLGVSDFIIPPNDKLTFENFQTIYETNKKVYDKIAEILKNKPDKTTYDIYKKLYDSLCIMNMHFEYFTLQDGTIATTYTQFLGYKNYKLYKFLEDISSIVDISKRQEKILNAIQSIITSLDSYITSDEIELLNVFSGLPGISIDFIKSYITEVINYFKSFKIYVKNSTLIYLIDDSIENIVYVLDQLTISMINLSPGDAVIVEDQPMNVQTNLTNKENIKLLDKIWMYIYANLQKTYEEYLSNDRYSAQCDTIREEISLLSKLYEDDYESTETFVIGSTEYVKHLTRIHDALSMIISYILSDSLSDEMREEYIPTLTLLKDEYTSSNIDDVIYSLTRTVES